MKLGKINVHHYAHRADDLCPSTQPETALHLNTKYHIAHQLKAASKLFADQNCSGACGDKTQYLFLSDWDDVQVECGIGPYWADVALLRDGQVIGVIEIFVAHKTEEEKARYFDENNIPWIEVPVYDDEIYLGDNAWTADDPLPQMNLTFGSNRWTCDECNEEKLHVFKLLQNASQFPILQECTSIGCEKRKEADFLSGWDDVKFDHKTGPYSADIALLRDGKIMGAVDFFRGAKEVSLEEPTIKYHAENNIRWIGCWLPRPDTRRSWFENECLSVLSSYYHPEVANWTCSKCQTEKRSRLNRDREVADLARFETHAIKMVDFYFKSGKKWREVYSVIKRIDDGKWVEARVKTRDRDQLGKAFDPALEITPEDLKRLNQTVQKDITRREKKCDHIDVIVPWTKWDTRHAFLDGDLDRYPFKYTWNDWHQGWKHATKKRNSSRKFRKTMGHGP
jgi:hypothetical protein